MLHHGANEAYEAAAAEAEHDTPGNRGPAATAAPQQLSSVAPAVLEAAQAGAQGSDCEALTLASQEHAESALSNRADVRGTFKAQTADVAEWSDSMRLAISTRCLLAVLSIAEPSICYTQVPAHSWLPMSPLTALHQMLGGALCKV